MREGGLKYPLKLYELWKRNEREWAGGTAGGSATRVGVGSLIKYHTTYYGEGGDTACVVSMASGNVDDTHRETEKFVSTSEWAPRSSNRQQRRTRLPPEVNGGRRAVPTLQRHRYPFIKRPVWKFHSATLALLLYSPPASTRLLIQFSRKERHSSNGARTTIYFLIS